MAVKLDFLQSNLPITPPQIGEEYLYKDLMLDLTIDYTRSTQLLKNQEVKDVKAIFEYDAVARSLRNAFETLPGQKILNPLFGLGKWVSLFISMIVFAVGLRAIDFLFTGSEVFSLCCFIVCLEHVLCESYNLPTNCNNLALTKHPV